MGNHCCGEATKEAQQEVQIDSYRREPSIICQQSIAPSPSPSNSILGYCPSLSINTKSQNLIKSKDYISALSEKISEKAESEYESYREIQLNKASESPDLTKQHSPNNLNKKFLLMIE